ncbi:hypothetical protein QBC34DRAFT_69408 [Podospora aff. communis PSN243]|uniref:Shugoshin n=1 Tax=Podospora aff. communis PSN243 TaxID=3040156 RepID=A0AAV9H8V0_9PEZI|nr:hypothetical protein QBC34DRAFT_69408 [Podospora aff. communis PSN243]
MARLNEPPAPMESNLDILRRKFLRQNRDLARVNSNQSNRIRTLENECARLLSENLDLRGQVMRLEKELENNAADRIADHALEIKAKMEAQLAELAAMVAGLGTEPPAKRHSPERRIPARHAPRGLKSPAQRRPRQTSADPETLAAQEGRLPPIYENKSYPRATMNSEQILALCAEAADTSTSPEIGPPPVSRYVDEDVVRETPVKNTEKVQRGPVEENRMDMEQVMPPPKLDFQRKSPDNSEPVKQPPKEPAVVPTKVSKPVTEVEHERTSPSATPIVPTTKAGAKRKYGDENDLRGPRPSSGKENSAVPETANKPAAGGVSKPRVIKEIPANRKKALGRPPLSAKSTNEDMSSPQKVSKEDTAKPMKPQQQPATLKDVLQRERERKPAAVPKLEIPSLPEPTPPVVTILPEHCEPKTPGLALISPDTPDRSAPREMALDTPPPGHLSVDGETSRPSRRARAAISYAEPNLRDKMRRPTKELFDAVSGEGKFKARVSTSAVQTQGGTESAPTSVSKPVSEGWTTASGVKADGNSTKEATIRENMRSPLAQRDQQPAAMDVLPSSVVMERKRRPSAIGGGRDSLAAAPREQDNEAEAPVSSKPKNNPSAAKAERNFDSMDVYDFASSPASQTKESPRPPSEDSNRSKRQPRRASAAAHQALRDIAAAMEATGNELPHPPKGRSGHARKRASMLAPKKPMVIDSPEADYQDDSSLNSRDGDGTTAAGGDKISRRRSMML